MTWIALRRPLVLVWYVVAFLGSNPLLAFAATVVFLKPGWHAGLLCVLAVFTTWGIAATVPNADINHSVDDAAGFWRAFEHCTFTRVPLDEFLGALRPFHPRRDSYTAEQFRRDVVPAAARYNPGRLRVVVASTRDATARAPGQSVTFASYAGAWVILHKPLAEMNDISYFVLMHEIGHTCLSAFASRALAVTRRKMMLRAVPFLAIAITPTPLQMIVLLLLTVGWYAAAAWEARGFGELAEFENEVRADVFALKRCDQRWCAAYPETYVARALSLQPDSRARVFVDNVRALRAGQAPAQPHSLRRVPPASVLESLLALSIMVTCGMALGPFTWIRAVLLAVVTIAALACAALVSVVQHFQAALIDDRFGIAPIDPRMMTLLERMAGRQEQLKSWGVLR